MSERIGIFWPGDYRVAPNKLALPNVEQATAQLEAALARLGRRTFRVEGWLTRPDEAIERLGPVDEPLVGICVHWFYGPHTTDGVVGKDNPLLLASNFSGQWPGLVGLLNTGACLESVGRRFSRAWTAAVDWTADDGFMARLDEWCRSGRIDYPSDELSDQAKVSPEAGALAEQVAREIRARRVLALMLGDTSMGMINGYFGHRLLNPIGFTEHKVDQAWILDRGKGIEDQRIDAALEFVTEKGVTFHYEEKNAEDFNEHATREQLRDYLAVLDLVDEFKADCLGWQYQLGLLPLRPPSDFAEGLFNSACRPESSGEPIITATEADQGNLVPMELMKRLLKGKQLHPAVMFHDVRWGGELDGRFVWVLLNSGSCGAYAFNHDPDSLAGVHSYRQPAGYFPVPGGTFAGESLPGKITWARAWIRSASAAAERVAGRSSAAGTKDEGRRTKDEGRRARDKEAHAGPASAVCTNELVMDIGTGDVVKLPPEKRDAWWEGTTRQWPFMAADLHVSQQTLMAHYMSNHIAVAYGDIFAEMIALSRSLGFRVRVWGRH